MACFRYGKSIPVERLLLTQNYSRFFASTLHLGRWSPEEVSATGTTLSYMQGIGVRAHWYASLPRACAMLEARYVASQNGSRGHCKGGPRHPVPCHTFSGLLVFHGDMWVNVASLVRSNVNFEVGWYAPLWICLIPSALALLCCICPIGKDHTLWRAASVGMCFVSISRDSMPWYYIRSCPHWLQDQPSLFSSSGCLDPLKTSPLTVQYQQLGCSTCLQCKAGASTKCPPPMKAHRVWKSPIAFQPARLQIARVGTDIGLIVSTACST